ncbi:MAG: mandelate racemase/muconate lactonizing enzyme family protein [Halobacteriales archaeon]
MEITDVVAVPLRRELDERFANAQKWIESREYCLVRLDTDAGVSGWGECWGPIAANRELIEETVGPRLIGCDPRDVARLHDELVFELTASYHSYTPASVISGIDIACWDAYGKAVGEPVARLLGGRRRDSVRAYATGGFFRDVDAFEPLRETIVEEATAHVEQGFDALKLKIGLDRHFPWDEQADIELVRAVRQAVGDDVRLMADANHAYDLATARRVADALADLDVYFFEEPVVPHAIECYRTLSRDTSMAIAGGECWAFEHEFQRAIDDGEVGIVQPDVTSAGGLTTARRVGSLAAANTVQCIPHVFGSAVALAASLQFIATVPGTPMLEYDRTPNPLRDELAAVVDQDGSRVRIPDRPGIGVEPEPAVLDRFRVA